MDFILISFLFLCIAIVVYYFAMRHRRYYIPLATGIRKYQIGDLDSAEQYLSEAIQANEKRWQPYLMRGVIRSNKRNFDAAISDLNQAIAINPNVALAYNNRGYIYSLTGDFDKALEDCNGALKLDPTLFLAYGSRGHTYFLMTRYHEAFEDFQKSAELKPDHVFAIAGQSVTQNALGHTEEARQLWQALLAVDNEYENASKLKEERCICRGCATGRSALKRDVLTGCSVERLYRITLPGYRLKIRSIGWEIKSSRLIIDCLCFIAGMPSG